MFYKNKANKRRREFWLLFALVLMLLLMPAWSAWQGRISKWTLLGKNDLASVRVEQSLYESSGSNRFFVRFRVTNETHKPLAVNLEDNQGLWKAFYPYQWTLAEGDHRGIVSEMKPLPLTEDIKVNEAKILAAYKVGKLTIIPPSGTADYYRESMSGGRVDIEKRWNSCPLWMKSKSYLPRSPFPLHFILGVRGLISVTDGKSTKTFLNIGSDVGFPFPLRWKQLPPKT